MKMFILEFLHSLQKCISIHNTELFPNFCVNTVFASVLCVLSLVFTRIFDYIFIPVCGVLWSFWQDACIQSVQPEPTSGAAVRRCWSW